MLTQYFCIILVIDRLSGLVARAGKDIDIQTFFKPHFLDSSDLNFGFKRPQNENVQRNFKIYLMYDHSTLSIIIADYSVQYAQSKNANKLSPNLKIVFLINALH